MTASVVLVAKAVVIVCGIWSPIRAILRPVDGDIEGRLFMAGIESIKDVVSDHRVILEEYESVAGTAANSFELMKFLIWT
jgi:hypothetical protein